MRIRYLTLANFRGLKDKALKLDSDKVTIYGQNGTGKTTVANAISYLLTDSPATGEKDFSPKTEGSHNLNHVAEMAVTTEEGDLTLKKDFHEVWKKKRGSQAPEFSGHETDYFLNGVPSKKKDYESAVKGICDGDAQKSLMLSRVGYFAEELPPAERRKVLLEICGDVSDDEVMKQEGLQGLSEVLKMPGSSSGQRYTVEEYLQIAKGQRRDLNQQIDNLPARIDELTRAQPGETREESVIEAEIKELEKQKLDVLNTNMDTTGPALEAAIAGAKVAIEKGRERFLSSGNAGKEELMERISALRQEKARQAEAQMEVAEKVLQTQNDLRKMEAKRVELLQEFEDLKAQRWDESQEVCPTCGQSLPPDTVKTLRQNFMESLAERKADINRRGKECSKQAIEEAKERLEGLLEKQNELQVEIEAFAEKIAGLHKELAVVPLYEETEGYKKEKERLDKLQQELADHQAVTARQRETPELDAKISALHEEKANLRAAKAVEGRIEELKEEQKKLGADLDRVDRNIHLCEEFFREKVRLLSKKVDDHFESVGFLLFKDQINGGLKEVCEPLVPDMSGGMVEYKSANTAAQVNAGLEIIKVLSDYYDTYLPVIVDRAESVNHLLDMPKHQVIRLVVSEEDKDLRVVCE